MNVVTGLASLFVAGAAAVAATLWLGRRRSQVTRLLSVLFGVATAAFCAFAAFALIADNAGMMPRPAGVAATVVFALTAMAAAIAVARSITRRAIMTRTSWHATIAATVFIAPAAGAAQTVDPPLRFEVAAITASTPDSGRALE
jgi:hypothetical protein